jgi:hypothetical protein
MDLWMAESGDVEFRLISGGSGTEQAVAEAGIALSGVAGWNSFNIDLDAFGSVDQSNITQAIFRIENLGVPLFDSPATDFYLDNVYFNSSAPTMPVLMA